MTVQIKNKTKCVTRRDGHTVALKHQRLAILNQKTDDIRKMPHL